jgi:hypothetical protein
LDSSFVRANFSGGEWSQTMQGRFDRPDYLTSLNVCLNGFPIETGAWVRRPGTQFCGTTRNGSAGRLITFDFQVGSSYTFELTDSQLRAWSGANLATTNDDQVVLGISTATPAVVATVGFHGWSSAQQIIFKSMGAACPLLQNRHFSITVLSANTFSINDALTGTAIDGSTLGVAALVGTEKVARILEIATPYAAGTWANVRTVQAFSTSNNIQTVQSIFLNPAFQPYVVSVNAAPAAPAFATFTTFSTGLSDGPYLDPITTDTLSLSGFSGDVTMTAGSTNFGGFKSTDVKRHVRMMCEPPLWNSGTTYTASQYVTWPTLGVGGPYYLSLVNANTTQPGTDATKWVTVAAEGSTTFRWLWGFITSVSSATVAGIHLQINALQYPEGPGPTTALPVFTVWRLGAYSDTTGWPSCGTFSEGRLWISGGLGNRIDASVSNDILNFAPTNLVGHVLDSSAISYTFNGPDVNPISWMIPDLQGITCGTKAGEWLVQSPSNGPLTPTSIAAHRTTKIGGANIEPHRTEHTTVFVQKFGRKVMEYFSDVSSGKFTAPHLSLTGKHLTLGGIDEIAYQQELAPTVWARVKGKLIGCSYKRDTLTTTQGPTQAGWHRHVLGSGRLVESICVGPSVDGTLDSLSMVTKDPVTNIRHVEIMTSILDEAAALSSAWYLDDAIVPTSTSTSDVTPAPYGGLTLNGLSYLNGKKVTVFAGGLDCGDYTVANGSVTVPYGDGISGGTGSGLFTAAFAATAAIVAGFTFTSQGQLTRPESPVESGARNGPAFGKKRRNQEYAIQVNHSAGISVGTSFAKLFPIPFKNDANVSLAAGNTFTGIYQDTILDDYSLDGMLCWQITRPLPANIIAFGGFLHTMDH